MYSLIHAPSDVGLKKLRCIFSKNGIFFTFVVVSQIRYLCPNFSNFLTTSPILMILLPYDRRVKPYAFSLLLPHSEA